MPLSDLMFHELPRIMPRLTVPGAFERALKAKRTGQGSRWMRRYELEESTLRKGAWNVFVLTSVAAMFALVVLAVAAGPGTAVYAIVPCSLAPAIASSVYLNAPESFAQAEERRMLREGPSAIGCMAMSMQVTPSLERAVAFASVRGGEVLAQRLREAQWVNLTRSKGSLNEALEDLASSLSDANSSLKQALHLVISSTCERTKEGMDRLLDKANSTAMAGVRDAVESYVASLSLPTMVLFALGTLLPIMLFSVLPLLSLGTSLGAGGEGAVPFPYLALLLLAAIPLAALAYSWSILSRNPLGLVKSDGDARRILTPALALVWAASVGASLLSPAGVREYALSGAVVLTPCAYIGWTLRGRSAGQKEREALDREGSAALFQIGNRMLSGATFEGALEVVTSGTSGAFSDLARTLLYRARLSGAGLDRIIVEEGGLRAASPDLESAYVTVAQCARRDPRYAGQIALNLAQMLSDLRACQGKVEERLRGVVEMMRSTGTLFAPIVLGVTGALFALIGTKASATDGLASDIGLVTGVYIGELSFLVSFFTVLLMGERSWTGVARSYALRTPVAFGVFVAVTIICRTGLTALL